MKIEEFNEKAATLRHLTDLDIELDFNHYVKFGSVCLDMKSFSVSLSESGFDFNNSVSLDTFIKEKWGKESLNIFYEIL